MAREKANFEPLESETAIYLRQVSKESYDAAGETAKLSVSTVGDEGAVTIGVLRTHGPGEWIAWGGGVLFLALLGAFGVLVLRAIWRGEISLKYLISEKDGKASLSRFQALIFTFVFMIAILLIVIETGRFPTEIPLNVLLILGGSLATYLTAKAIGEQGTGEAALVAPSGRLLRIASTVKPASLTIDPSHVSSGLEPYQIDIPVTAKGPNPWVPVAVCVGEMRLRLTIEQPEAGLSEKTVRFVDAVAGKQVEIELRDGAEIRTVAGKISEVFVHFTAVSAFGTVRVKVEAL